MNIIVKFKNTKKHELVIGKQIIYKPKYNILETEYVNFIKKIGNKLFQKHPFILKGVITKEKNYLIVVLNNEQKAISLTLKKKIKPINLHSIINLTNKYITKKILKNAYNNYSL